MPKEWADNANQATTTNCLVIKQLVVLAHKGLATRKAANANRAATSSCVTTYNQVNYTSSDCIVVVGLAILCNLSSPSSYRIAEHQAIELLIPTMGNL
jgi:hypothetical protein